MSQRVTFLHDRESLLVAGVGAFARDVPQAQLAYLGVLQQGQLRIAHAGAPYVAQRTCPSGPNIGERRHR